MGNVMEDIIKEISYLKGLADGMDIDRKSNEGILILKIIDALELVADKLSDIDMDIDGLCEAVEDIGLGMFDDEDEDDDDFDDEYDYDSEDDLYEIECPNCHEDVMIEYDMIDDENAIICPNCHKEISLEFDSEDDYEEQ